jgi:hypothetical protein
MKNKYITIGYWHHHKYPEFKYNHMDEMPYSPEALNEIIQHVIGNGYSVMIRPFNIDNEMIIWIDKHRFGQK